MGLKMNCPTVSEHVANTSPVAARRLYPVLTTMLALVTVLALWVATTQPSKAADAEVATSSYIAPLSGKKNYRLVVIGDSVGANLADGLRWTFRRRDGVKVKKQTKAGTGFVRTDVYNWPRAIRRLVRRGRTDIIVILVGGNDRQDMRVRGRRHERFSKKWWAEYRKRLDKAASMLNSSGAAIYWIGLPNVRSRRMTRDYENFNRLFERIANKYNFRFIRIKRLFERNGRGYSDYGRGLSGKRVRLRSRDGIHMSTRGSKLLGRYVADHILEDMPRRTALRGQVQKSTQYVKKRASQ